MGTAESTRILIVDDDPEIRDMIREYLSDEGFVVAEADNGAAMRDIVDAHLPDIVLLDLKLPGEDGFTLARAIRDQHESVGIIMISGKEDVVDRVAGLEVGADDYLTKPFHLRELLARVRSVMRRRVNSSQSPADVSKDAVTPLKSPAGHRTYEFAGWLLDCSGRQLTNVNGSAVQLTSGEFDLLEVFVTRPNRALSREQLLDLARHRDAEVFDRSIDVQIGRLRRKIEADPKRPSIIKTVRNVGYMFDGDVIIHSDAA